ncbi:hypothetical protein [Flexithrix dorotheae]|uniref:hypothetical protein n=1 Tax=Flexithrix dorotheae TaxID=70993 RepID=UPI0003A85A2D|nr:hypothetical protein [Flexithrix dorotheae]
MPQKNPLLISALKETASRLEKGANYEWGHMGRCNCGHLVQTITDMSDKEIVESIDFQMDEWTEHANDYCNNTGSKVDEIFNQLNEIGFNYEDIVKLEYLSDKSILEKVGENTYLRHNCVDDVVLYMNTMAEMLEES